MRDVYRVRFNLGTTVPVKMSEQQGLSIASAEHKHLRMSMDDDKNELVVEGESINGKAVKFRVPKANISWHILTEEVEGFTVEKAKAPKVKAA